jgi:hypothetical protein
MFHVEQEVTVTSLKGKDGAVFHVEHDIENRRFRNNTFRCFTWNN